MNSSFKPEAGKSNNNNSSKAADPLVPSPDCARNPRTPVDYLRFLTQFPNLHADLALNPALPPDLEQWIKGHPDPRVQENLRAVTRPLPPVKSPVTSGVPSPAAPTQVFPYPPGNPQGYPQVPGSQVPGFSAMPNYPQGVPVPGRRVYQPLPGQYLKPRRKRRWLIPLIATVAALVIIGGGIGAYFAFAGFRHVGYDSPEELADALKASLDESDLIGIAQMSAPSEDVIVQDTLQLNKGLKQLISTDGSNPQGESGQLENKISDLTSVMRNLDIDTSRLDSKVESLSDDISRINYSGKIDVKIKDRNKLKAGLDKLVFNNQDTPKKETKLNYLLGKIDDLEKDGIDYKTPTPLQIMAVREANKWYYSVLTSCVDYIAVGAGGTRGNRVDYNVNWADPGETPSDSGQFVKELSGAITRVSNLDELTSEDCMRFLDIPERRIVMIYASPQAKGDISPRMDLKISLSEDKKSSYGFAFNLDNLKIDVDDMGWEIVGGKGTYSYERGKQTSDFGDYIKNGKLQLVAKATKQGLKLSFSGSLANFFNNLDYDLGNEYFQENKDEFYRGYEKQIDEDPFRKPYKKLILGYFGLGKKMGAEMDREDYNYDSDYDDSDYDD